MNRPACGVVAASGGVQAMFGGVFEFIHRNGRAALVVSLVAAAVGAASAVGWITAPVP
ncbi:MAG: hypothetical protein H2038_01390 [Brevundimonas sp.]|uniref:hypothetical protein n=1 Tax=Brevundimonas sp. TaxID=1871086 RepID=UPI0017D33560|nr:hypothetical protein [Brevundimonas sp.]MBA4803285.1 hypothetical protein [Brevundimonas sp.]